jgi:hypothetical protein
MPRKPRRVDAGNPEASLEVLPHDAEATRIADMYPPVVVDGTPEERKALLAPPKRGYMGREYAPLKSSEMDQVAKHIDAVGAVALDLTDAPDRLNRIRRWILEDETFERDLWLSIRTRAVKYGARDSLKLVMRLLYGWRDTDDVSKQLEGHSVEEAKSALRAVDEASTLTMHDLAENAITFFAAYFKKHPEMKAEVVDRIERLSQ